MDGGSRCCCTSLSSPLSINKLFEAGYFVARVLQRSDLHRWIPNYSKHRPPKDNSKVQKQGRDKGGWSHPQ